MALTSTQKSSVRRYLGYPDVNRESHHALEGALDALSADGETVVGDSLARLDLVGATLQSSWGRQKVVKAEEVTLAGAGEIRALRAEGRRLAHGLAATLGVPVHRDVFNSGSRSGVARRG